MNTVITVPFITISYVYAPNTVKQYSELRKTIPMSHRAPQLYWVLPASHLVVTVLLRAEKGPNGNAGLASATSLVKPVEEWRRLCWNRYKAIKNEKCLKLKLIHHASKPPVYLVEFSFSPMYVQMSRNYSFSRRHCLPVEMDAVEWSDAVESKWPAAQVAPCAPQPFFTLEACTNGGKCVKGRATPPSLVVLLGNVSSYFDTCLWVHHFVFRYSYFDTRISILVCEKTKQACFMASSSFPHVWGMHNSRLRKAAYFRQFVFWETQTACLL